jgi:calcium-dependent protein kinase
MLRLENTIREVIYYKIDTEWEHVSKEGWNLVESMIKVEVSKRISVQDAIKHPWFTKFLHRKKLSDEKMNEYYRNMIQFKTDPKFFFQQATLAYMVHHITTKDETDDIRKFFSHIDKNGDGKMSYSEIIDGMKQYVNIENEKHLTRVFKFIDQGKAGYIEFEEFVRSCINKHKLLTTDNLKTTFLLFTKEEGRDMPVQEFKAVLGLSSKFSDKAWEQIIKSIDLNGDGNIDVNEFVDMMVKFLNGDS